MPHHAEVNRVEISRNYGSDLPLIEVDPTQMEQVFINLLVNACQAMPHGGRLAISMHADFERACMTTRIEDSGHGISEENLGRIFDPFFSTKGQELNSVAGTGLGLSIVKWIVDAHGGNISVESTVGEGSTFSVRLPFSGPEEGTYPKSTRLA